MRRFRLWKLRRIHRHKHVGNVGARHSHLHHEIDHGHEIDACCLRRECHDFPLHRVHPRPVK